MSTGGWVVHRIRRVLAAALLTLCCAGAASGVTAAAQPAPARDEFVPVKELGPQEQLPAAPLVIAAYGVAWLLIFLYVWSLWRRLSRVEGELKALNSRLSAKGR